VKSLKSQLRFNKRELKHAKSLLIKTTDPKLKSKTEVKIRKLNKRIEKLKSKLEKEHKKLEKKRTKSSAFKKTTSKKSNLSEYKKKK